MWHRVKDLSSEQRVIQPSRILKEAPTGEERTRAYSQYLGHLDTLADRVKGVSDAELETIIDEACGHARHSPS